MPSATGRTSWNGWLRKVLFMAKEGSWMCQWSAYWWRRMSRWWLGAGVRWLLNLGLPVPYPAALCGGAAGLALRAGQWEPRVLSSFPFSPAAAEGL